MAIEPTEQFDHHESPETLPEKKNPRRIGGKAIEAANGEPAEPNPETLQHINLYEAAYHPGELTEQDIDEAINGMVMRATLKGLLETKQAEWLRHRLKGMDEPEPETLSKKTLSQYLLALARTYPGELNTETQVERRRHALAMKGLLLKFLGEHMTIGELEEWVGSITDRNNVFSAIDPDEVRLETAGAFDAVFRRAPRPLNSRD